MRRCSATQRNLSAFSRHDTPLPVRRIVAGFPFLLFTASKQQILPKCSVLVERDRSCASRVKAPDQDYKNPSAAGEAKRRRTTPAVSETQRTVSLTGYRPLYFYSRFRTVEEIAPRPPTGRSFQAGLRPGFIFAPEKSSERSCPKTAAVYPNSSVER